MSELQKESDALKRLSIDELKEHVKELEKAGYAIKYAAVKTLMAEETEDKEKRSVARKQIRQAYQNPPPKKESAGSDEHTPEDLARFAELNKKNIKAKIKGDIDDLKHMAQTLQVERFSKLTKEPLIWAIIEKEKKLASGEEKITTKVRKNAAQKSPAALKKIPAGAVTESEPKKKKNASPKSSPKSSPASSPSSSQKSSPKNSPRPSQKSTTKSATKSASASGSGSKSKTKSSSGGDPEDSNYCGQKNDFACPPGKVCSADARMCISEKIGMKAQASVLFKGHKVVGSNDAIAKLKGVMARKCGAESYDALAAKSLEDIKKKLKAKGIDASGVTDKEKAIDLLCEYSIHSKTCDAKGNFACPGDLVCNVSSKPGVCVGADSKEAATWKYKGHNIIGSKSAIEALKKQLEKKPVAVAKPVAKPKSPKKGPNYRTDPLTKEQLITVISSITGRSPDYYKKQDISSLTKLYDKVSKDYQKAMELAIQLSELTGMSRDEFDSWTIEQMEFEINRYQKEEIVHVDEEEAESEAEEKQKEESESEEESEEEQKISKPKTASLAGIDFSKSPSLTKKMKAMVVQDEEDKEAEEEPEEKVKPKPKEKPKPVKPKEKPKPKSASESEAEEEESDEDKNEVSAKVQKIIKNIKAGKKADDGTEISQWQQAVIKCLGLGA